MKIPKTEKEFLDALEGALHETNLGKKPWVNTVADALKRRLGLEFKEEEPELPERVRTTRVSVNPEQEILALVDAGDACEGVVGASIRRLAAMTTEAAARYNALGRITKSLRAPGVFSLIPLPRGWAERKMEVGDLADWLEGLLAEERERLQ